MNSRKLMNGFAVICLIAISTVIGSAQIKKETRSDKIIAAGPVITLVDSVSYPAQQVNIPVQAEATGIEHSVTFSMTYDSTKMSNPTVTLGADTQGSTYSVDTSTPDTIGITLTLPSTDVLPAGTRDLFTITMDAASNADGATPVDYTNAPVVSDVKDVGGTSIPATWDPGTVTFLGPSAAGVVVSGNVVSDNGAGISRAVVSLTDQNGEVRSVVTNQFGRYEFTDVPAGQVYILSVRHSKYTFRTSAYALNVTEDLTGITFVGGLW